MSAKSKKSSISGFYITQAKQIAKRYFGGDFDKIIHGGKVFEIYIKDSVNKEDLDEFMDMYPEFNVNLLASIRYEKQTKSKK